jgi:ABC-2 type transport system ATP-binding protein
MNHGDVIALESTSTLLKELGTRSMLVHLQAPIKELPANLCCQAVELDDSGTTLRLTLSASQSTGELLKHLCDINLPIADIETRKAGLEEIFLQMTKAGKAKP